MSTALSLSSVCKSYQDHQVLTDLTLHVEEGEIYCLLGHNGAGKTTTVHLILNFDTPNSGVIEVFGQNVQTNPQEARQLMAYIPEQVTLYPELNALENLRYFALLSGNKAPKAQLENYLKQSGLQPDLFKKPLRYYSKGMRQKVGIAIALSKQARLLILDEPTSGLDPSASFTFSQSLQDIAKSGVAIFMVTHDLFRVRELSAKVGILKRGVLQDSFEADSLSHTELEQRYLELAC